MRKAPFVCVLVIGLGLAVAPLAFQMFTRAPKGAVMLDEFRPYMTAERINGFQEYMAEIDEAVAESDTELRPFFAEQAGVDDAEFERRFATFTGFSEEWPSISADMDDLLDRVEANIDSYEAVDALPPFTLFPWFFVAPGLLMAGLAAVALLRPASGGVARWALVGVSVALVAAPFAFQMFQRAPKGGEMMTDFETLMTRNRVQTVQNYFGTMSVGEGGIRLELIPAAQQAGGLTESELTERFPAVTRLRDDWVGIINDMTPMIGAMSDNVDNYDALAALPRFPLFPWFFVAPGLLVAVLAFAGGRNPSYPRTRKDPRDEQASLPSLWPHTARARAPGRGMRRQRRRWFERRRRGIARIGAERHKR